MSTDQSKTIGTITQEAQGQRVEGVGERLNEVRAGERRVVDED